MVATVEPMASAFGVRLKREITGGVLSGTATTPPPPGWVGVVPVGCGWGWGWGWGWGAVTPAIRAICPVFCPVCSRLTKSVLFGPGAILRGPPEPAGRLIGVVSVPSVARRATACVLNWAIQYAPSA